MSSLKVDINKIKVTDRIRKEALKIEELAADISNNGLINPLTVLAENDGEYRLIAGLRRLRAAQVLGFVEIEVTILSPADAEAELKIAIAENEQREQFTFSEKMNYARLIEEIEKTKALGRKSIGGKGGFGTEEISEDPDPGPGLQTGECRDIIGEKIGMSGRQYDRAKYIAENAPQEIIDELDKGERTIRPTYDELKKSKSSDSEDASKSESERKPQKSVTTSKNMPQTKPSEISRLSPEEIDKFYEDIGKDCTPEQKEVMQLRREIGQLKTENNCLKNNLLQLECGIAGYKRRIDELEAALEAANASIVELKANTVDGH